MAKKKHVGDEPSRLLMSRIKDLVTFELITNPVFFGGGDCGNNPAAAIATVLIELRRFADWTISDEVPKDYDAVTKEIINAAFDRKKKYRGGDVIVDKIAPPIVEALKNLGIILTPNG